MKEYKEITKEAFEKFIKTSSQENKKEFIGKKTGWAWVMFKIPFDENAQIDLIYLSHNYIKTKEYNFTLEKFELAGAICNKTKDVLLSSYYLEQLIKETGSSLNINYVSSICNISKDVSDELTKQIKEHWNMIKLDAKDKSYFNDDYTKKYRAKEKAEEWFVKDNLTSTPEYSYNIKIEPEEDLLLEYYINKEKVLSNLVEHHFKERRESIYKSILCYEEACKLLPTLLNNKGLQIEKAIKDALKDIDCNMVTVKASKETPEGIKCGFWEGKVELSSIQRCKANTWLPIWKTPLAERKEFYKLFGDNTDLFPEDIDEITFRKKTLYKKGE